MPLDMKSILRKAKASIEPGGRAHDRFASCADKVALGNVKPKSNASVHTPEEAAEKFIDILRSAMVGAGLSANAASSISDLGYTAPRRSGAGGYEITVYFNQDLSRPSLDEARYGRVNDIALLLNEGVDHTMGHVHGTWHGKEAWSRTEIPATHFMEQAVTDFMTDYSDEYSVTGITINKYGETGN